MRKEKQVNAINLNRDDEAVTKKNRENLDISFNSRGTSRNWTYDV